MAVGKEFIDQFTFRLKAKLRIDVDSLGILLVHMQKDLVQIENLEAQHKELSKKEDIDLYAEDLDDLEKALGL